MPLPIRPGRVRFSRRCSCTTRRRHSSRTSSRKATVPSPSGTSRRSFLGIRSTTSPRRCPRCRVRACSTATGQTSRRVQRCGSLRGPSTRCSTLARPHPGREPIRSLPPADWCGRRLCRPPTTHRSSATRAERTRAKTQQRNPRIVGISTTPRAMSSQDARHICRSVPDRHHAAAEEQPAAIAHR